MLHLAPGFQKVDNTIQWICLYPVDNEIGFPTTYALDSDFYPVDSAIHNLNN